MGAGATSRLRPHGAPTAPGPTLPARALDAGARVAREYPPHQRAVSSGKADEWKGGRGGAELGGDGDALGASGLGPTPLDLVS